MMSERNQLYWTAYNAGYAAAMKTMAAYINRRTEALEQATVVQAKGESNNEFGAKM